MPSSMTSTSGLVHFIVDLLCAKWVAIYHPQDPDSGRQAGFTNVRRSPSVRKGPPTSSCPLLVGRLCVFATVQRDVDDRVPGVTDSDEQEHQRGAADGEQGRTRTALQYHRGDQQVHVCDERKDHEPEPVLEDRAVGRDSPSAVEDDEAIDTAQRTADAERHSGATESLPRRGENGRDQQRRSEVNDVRGTECVDLVLGTKRTNLGHERHDLEMQTGEGTGGGADDDVEVLPGGERGGCVHHSM